MRENLRIAIGARVARYRKEARLTQEQLAEQIGVRPETISRLERGHSLPSIEALDEIANVLSRNLRDLVSVESLESDATAAIAELVSDISKCSAPEIHIVRALVRAVLAELSKSGGLKKSRTATAGRLSKKKR
jgi:transcriptional regulator with XRE-family HTH domain